MKIQEFDRMEDLEAYLVSDEVADSYIDADEEIVNSEEFGDKDFVVDLGSFAYYEQGSPASAILNYHHALLRSAMVEGGKE